jgi:hypothetical protein
MPRTIQSFVDEIVEAIGPLPDGFYASPTVYDSIIVSNDKLGFAITRKASDDGLAIELAKKAFPMLLRCIDDLDAGRVDPAVFGIPRADDSC